MLTFRTDFLKIGNIDPLQYVTIASVCVAIYRSKYMPKNTIGIIKDVHKNTCSKTSIQWLKYTSETDNVYIQHAMNGGEHFIPNVGKVDVFVKRRTRYTNSKVVFGTDVRNVIQKIGLIQSINAIWSNYNERPNLKTLKFVI